MDQSGSSQTSSRFHIVALKQQRSTAIKQIVYIVIQLHLFIIAIVSSAAGLSEVQLVEEAAKLLPLNSKVSGFEEVVRKFNETENATIFTSVHMPDHVIRDIGNDDEGKDTIILPSDPEVKVPFRNVTTFVVLKTTPKKVSRYTSHLAYLRKFEAKYSVEWDLYSFHFHNTNGSFAQAFFPVREGPGTITIGLGYTLTRSRRGDVPPPGYRGPTPGYSNGLVQSPVTLFSQNVTQRRPPPMYISTQLQKPPFSLPFPRLQWSIKTTQNYFGIGDWTTSSDMNGEDSTTEYPMYGESPDDPNTFGYTTHPPWSEYRLQQTTPETTEEPGETAHSNQGTKLCFGLHRNCGEKAAPKPKIGKACIFGLRCKEGADRYAMKIMTTTTPSPIPDGDVEADNFPQKKKKKKKLYASLEECEEAQNNKGRSMQKSNTNWSPNFNQTSTVPTTTSPSIDLSSSKTDPSLAKSTMKTIADIRKEKVAEQLKIKSPGTTFKQKSMSSSTSRIAETVRRKRARKNGKNQRIKFLHGRRKRAVDPCAIYRTENEQPLGESLINIEDTTSMSSTLLKHNIFKNISDKAEQISTTNSKDVIDQTISPEINEDINPFFNSLGGMNSTPVSENATVDWDDAGTEILKPITPSDIGTVEPSSRDGVTIASTDDDAGNIILSSKKRRWLTSESDLSSSNLRKKDLSSELLDISKDEIKDGSEMDLHRPRKEDSDPQDLHNLDVPYIGIGDCDLLTLNFTSTLPSEKVELIDFFLKVLRSQCSPDIMNKTLELFDDELVIFESPTLITINRKNPFFQKKLFGEEDWLDYASAVLLSQFSAAFGEQLKKYNSNKMDNKSPDGKRLSGTVKTLTIISSRIFNTFKSTEKMHAIKFSNLLLVILQAQRSELATSSDELNKCSKCEEEKKVNFNDQVQIHAIMRFIIDELPEIIVSSNETEKMFNRFFISKVSTITQLVKDKIPFVY